MGVVFARGHRQEAAGVCQGPECKHLRAAAVADNDDARILAAVNVAAEKRLNLLRAGYFAGKADRPELWLMVAAELKTTHAQVQHAD
jgi:hypothetical protein